MASFAKNIAQQRRARGWTRKQAAEYLGITINSLDSYEQGHGYPRWPVLKRIVDRYQINHEALYTFLWPKS